VNEGARASGGRLEFQRQNLRVGIFVIVAFLAFALVVGFALNKRIFRREYHLRTSFPGIGGLQPGAEVLLRGYPIGRVTTIDLMMDPQVRFGVEFAVMESVKLPEGTKVRLSTRGFATKVLDVVTPGDATDPDSSPSPPAGRPVAYLSEGAVLQGTSGSDLDALMSDVLLLTRRITTTMQHLDTIVSDDLGPKLSKTLETVNGKLETITADLGATMRDARTLMARADATIEESRPRVSRILDGAGKEIDSLDALTRRADGVVSQIQDRLDPLLADLASNLKQIDEIARTLQSSVSGADLKATITNLKSMSERGDLLVTELQHRPWRLMRRVKGEKEELLEELEAERKAREAQEAAPKSP